MEFRILGSLEVETEGGLIPLGPTKQRALLALLLVNANRVVSRDQAVDALWSEQPPETAATALHGYVSGLRKILGGDRIETRPPGYLLRTDPGELDLEGFERLLAGARSLEAPAAAEQLRRALALWRGRPLADLGSAPFIEAERSRLEELRLGAIEDRVEADLALGRHALLVAELQPLVREHPLRERLRGQLMLALYRSGRQAEALEVYQRGRQLLAEELGLEPGEALKRLERGVLEQDPALGPISPPSGTSRCVAQPVSRRRRLFRPSRLALALGALASAGTVAGIAAALTGGSSALAVRAGSIAVVDPATNPLVDDVAVGKQPVAVAVGERGVWVADAEDRAVFRIDPGTRKVVDTIGLGTDVHDLAVGLGSVWVADGTDGTVTRIDPATDRVVARLPLGDSRQPVFWVATGAASVWATSGEQLVRLDPATNKIVARTPISATPTGLAAAGADAWIVTAEPRLLRFSQSTPNGAVAAFDLQASALAPAVGAGAVWLVIYLDRGLIQPFDRVSLSLGPGARTDVSPLDIAVGPRSVWAVDVHGTVLRIDPATASVMATISTAPTIRSSIAVGAGAVWVAIQQPR